MTGATPPAAGATGNVILTASNEASFFDSRERALKAVLLYAPPARALPCGRLREAAGALPTPRADPKTRSQLEVEKAEQEKERKLAKKKSKGK